MEAVEITCIFRVFWLALGVGRLYLAVRLFNCAAGHVVYSGFDQDDDTGSWEADPNEKILNAAAMLFVVDIDDIISGLTLTPALAGILERVPAVSGWLSSDPSSDYDYLKFLFSQSWLAALRFLGMCLVVMITYLVWISAIWPDVDPWPSLLINHSGPYFLLCGIWMVHCQLSSQKNGGPSQPSSVASEEPKQGKAAHAGHSPSPPPPEISETPGASAISPARTHLPGSVGEESEA